MKKIFFLFLVLGLFTELYAGEFKIFAGAKGSQSMTNMKLDLQTGIYSITTVNIGPISPSDFSLTDSSVTISYPGTCDKIFCRFDVPTEA